MREKEELESVACSVMRCTQAAIIAIGSEMLGPTRVDTNSLKITAALETYGVPVVRKSDRRRSRSPTSSRRSATRSTAPIS